MSGLTLVAVVDPAPGAEEEAIAYEDAVLALLADHGARLVARYRRVDEGPLERTCCGSPTPPRSRRSGPIRDEARSPTWPRACCDPSC